MFESSFGVEVDVVVLSVFVVGFLDSSNVSLTVVSLTLTMIWYLSYGPSNISYSLILICSFFLGFAAPNMCFNFFKSFVYENFKLYDFKSSYKMVKKFRSVRTPPVRTPP